MTLSTPHDIRRRSVVQGLLCAGVGAALPASAQTPTIPAPPPGRKAVSLPLLPDRPPLRAWWQDPIGMAPKAHLVVLHGSGEAGDDLQAVLRNGVDAFMQQAAAQAWALCVPQFEAGLKAWDVERLHALAVMLAPRGLPLQVLGISRGGYAVWNWLDQHGADLTAAVSICGGGVVPARCAARRVPVRAYHGALDDVVPMAQQQALIDAHRACGAEVDFTIYPDGNHGAWIPAFQDAALLPWLAARLTPPTTTASR